MLKLYLNGRCWCVDLLIMDLFFDDIVIIISLGDIFWFFLIRFLGIKIKFVVLNLLFWILFVWIRGK